MIAPSLNCNGFRARWQQPEGLREFSDIHVDAGGTYAMVRFRSSDPICPMVLLGSSPPERQGPKGPEFRSSSVVRAVVMAGKPDPDFEHEVTVLPVSGLMPGTTYHLLIKGVGHRNAVARFSTLGRRIEWWFDAVKATDRHDRPRDGVSLHVRATGNEGGACECRLESGRPPGAGAGPALMLRDEELVTVEAQLDHDDGPLLAATRHALSRPGPAENHSVPFVLKASHQGGFTLTGRLVVSHG